MYHSCVQRCKLQYRSILYLWRVLGSKFKVLLTNATNSRDIFGTKFVVKYWHAKHENRKCCPQHGALSAFTAALAFSAVTIAIPEPFLLPTAKEWYLGKGICSRIRIVVWKLSPNHDDERTWTTTRSFKCVFSPFESS
jgi:hypothetical protein